MTPLSVYPNHTRVITFASEGTCSLAYAVSQRGARRLLYDIGLVKLDNPLDITLREWCSEHPETTRPEDRKCLTVLPQLFDTHNPAGTASSDVSPEGEGGYRDKGGTANIRWSVRMNMDQILEGRTDYLDQYPDTS